MAWLILYMYTSVLCQISCMQLFNALWRGTRVMNAKVYVQVELEQAGFDPYKLEKVWDV